MKRFCFIKPILIVFFFAIFHAKQVLFKVVIVL